MDCRLRFGAQLWTSAEGVHPARGRAPADRVPMSVLECRAMPAPAISLHAVRKRYGSIAAVDGLDLDVPAGVCFGLLGPNGAGKSTTMRMLTAQTLADEGEISVLGYELPREAKQARLEMGVVPQLDNLDVELTCEQILMVFARLYRVPR